MKEWLRLVPTGVLIVLYVLLKLFPNVIWPIWYWSVLPFLILQLFLLLKFTVVKEGTAKIVTVLGKFHSVIMEWEGHYLDQKWNVVTEAPSEKSTKIFPLQLIGGLWLYGIWPFHQIYEYPLRWKHLKFEKEGYRVSFHDEVLDYVWLKPDVYFISIKGAETAPPERIPVDLEIAITMRVVNPYNFCFVAPSQPWEDISLRLEGAIRDEVANMKIDEVFKLKGEELYVENRVREGKIELEKKKLFSETLQKWGIEVADRGVQILSISSPRYAEALARQKEEELEAKGKAAKLMGVLVEAVKRQYGVEEDKDVKEVLEKEEVKEFLKETFRDLIVREMMLEKEAVKKIEVEGGGDIEKAILSILGLMKKI